MMSNRISLEAIQEATASSPPAFQVAFEARDGLILASGYLTEFFHSEEEAWLAARVIANNVEVVAKLFGQAGDRDYFDIVNIFVVDSDCRPIAGYQHKKLRSYPPDSRITSLIPSGSGAS